MPNQFEYECYFKSYEIAELCQGAADIVISVKVSYPPDVYPNFEIDAHKFIDGKKSGAPKQGCPKPC